MRSWLNSIWLLKSDLKQFFQNRIWKYTDVGLATFNMLADDKEILMEVWKVEINPSKKTLQIGIKN